MFLGLLEGDCSCLFFFCEVKGNDKEAVREEGKGKVILGLETRRDKKIRQVMDVCGEMNKRKRKG